MPTTTMTTPIGPLRLTGESGALHEILFLASDRERPAEAAGEEEARLLEEARRQLGLYFAGRLRAFALPLAPRGTDFQLLVWRALADIPFGETISYGELARRIGRPGAARAVGAANGQNPLPIVLPCHRVIGADGGLTGYGGGLDRKRALLELERRVAGGRSAEQLGLEWDAGLGRG